jgi:hypothetical protein
VTAELSWPGVHGPVRLGSPIVTFETPISQTGAAHTRTWKRQTAEWIWSDGLVRLLVTTEPITSTDPAWLVRVDLEVLQPVRIRRLWLPLETSCPTPPYCIDRHLAWRPLRDPVHVTEQTPFVLSWQLDSQGMELRVLRGWCAARLAWSSGVLSFSLCLDAAALHPRWSFSGSERSRGAPVRESGERLRLELLLQRVAAPLARPVVLGRFPVGAEAAFTITDHCDFDSLETLRAFLVGNRGGGGWLGRGLRLTKGVFSIPSRPVNRPPTPSLADSEYRALARQLHADGSEIAPHGLNETGQIDRVVFRDALASIARDFQPRTWIDHGVSLPHCYSMGGADPDTYDLLAALRHVGITALWAYHDAPAEPAESLNLLDPRDGTRTQARYLFTHLRRREWPIAAHYLRTGIRNATILSRLQPVVDTAFTGGRELYMSLREGKPASQILGRGLRAGRRFGRAVLAPVKQPTHQRSELLALAPVVYPERAAPVRSMTPDEPLLFVTQEVVHTSDAYRPDALQKLIAERGLHIGHCYLTNRLPYLAGLFDPNPGPPQLGTSWLQFLDALEATVRDGFVWNPAMGELAEWLRILQLVAVVPIAPRRVRLDNPLARTIHGFTLLLPNDVQPNSVRWNDVGASGWRRWSDWLSVWGDLPPAASTIIDW